MPLHQQPLVGQVLQQCWAEQQLLLVVLTVRTRLEVQQEACLKMTQSHQKQALLVLEH
jgi:hypothetical protein